MFRQRGRQGRAVTVTAERVRSAVSARHSRAQAVPPAVLPAHTRGHSTGHKERRKHTTPIQTKENIHNHPSKSTQQKGKERPALKPRKMSSSPCGSRPPSLGMSYCQKRWTAHCCWRPQPPKAAAIESWSSQAHPTAEQHSQSLCNGDKNTRTHTQQAGRATQGSASKQAGRRAGVKRCTSRR